MTQRLDIFSLAPDLYRALVRMEQAAKKDLDPVVFELVKLRASQINHCAFCIDMHSKDARAAGETEQRLYLLNAWEEVPHLYTEKEQAALALTEAVTVLTDGFVPDAVYERAAVHFDEQELARLIGVLTVINAWNRMAVTSRTKAGDYQPGQYEQQA
ncbi:carboxymuconolactone decarboxylase family protein [Streptomyces sp. WMMC500]|uniref:carboxymuconolactone decarboxylase family protein n=1 Tax=Streptomyces sp. WMMC500 TaxID=3015154 RepID=UPI00248C7357|nr:carboxymuconolactone decarboxylase family protein [Streptomyces sp. WMMC500]WBB63634.1 carboxymuconolactone decarboxylase family protein [Streptomyces sp. WMMC500]